MKRCSLLIRNTAETAGPGFPETDLGQDWICIPDGAVAVDGDRIVAIGPRVEVESDWQADEVVDAAGGTLTPALCDPHTHLLFAGWREREFAARVSGRPLAADGLSGGISYTVGETTSASRERLEEILARRLDHWLECGVTLVEIKSGYGLTVESELRMLEIIRRVSQGHPVEVVSTVLAAHSLPASHRGRPREYLEEVAWPATRLARERGLAEFADVFIEEGAFSCEDAESYLVRAGEIGLGLRIHADQLSRGGGVALAARLGAASVDHLEQAGEEEVRALRGKSTVATLLPGAVLTVEGRGANRPPARSLIDAGVALAVATDFNPGTSTQPAPSLTPALACRLLGLTPEESLTAATRNAALSLGRAEITGSLSVGRRADLCIWPVPQAVDLAYQLTVHRPRTVVAAGKIVVGTGALRSGPAA